MNVDWAKTEINLDKNFFFQACFFLFLSLFGGVLLLFYWLLLLETAYKCDTNDKALDCFKYHLKFWHLKTIKNFSKEGIDCNSEAVRNGPVEVLCFMIVLNFGLAAFASYGSYQITICKIRVLLMLLSLGFTMVYIMAVVTSLRYYFR